MNLKTSLEMGKNISKPEQLITEHIDIWTSTILAKSTSGRGRSKKYELYGISKLRELILELAVRGKLVPQDINDEPASVLLEEIAAEKAQLIKEKKIKKQKNLPEVEDKNVLFETPRGWCWAYLQDVSSYIQRGKGPIYAEAGKVRVVSQKCIQWKGFDLNPCRYISDETLDKYQEERYLQDNDLLWNSTGTGTVGRVKIIDNIKINSLVADSHVTVIRPIKLNSTFLETYISSPFIQRRIDPNSENPLVSGSTKQVELNTSVVLSLLTPVPPLAEQQRIVDKVDELMLLCDQLEQQTEASIEAHATLVEVLLATLTDSTDSDELVQNWARIAKHFDSLFTTEKSIDALKQTVLQLAVMGKLVPQNPDDEPASVLLEKIAEEKEQLIKEKKIKKEKPLPAITDEEKPFELLQGWDWSKLGNCSANIHYGYTASANESLTDYRMLRITDIQHNNVNWESVPGCEITPKQAENYLLTDGDILIARTGGTVGKSYLVQNISVKSVFASYLIRVQKLDALYERYIKVFLESKSYWSQLYEAAMGTGQPNVNGNALKNLVLPVPPLAEQHRIVAKVDELMAICDQLKENLKQSKQTQVQLTDALVDQALG